MRHHSILLKWCLIVLLQMSLTPDHREWDAVCIVNPSIDYVNIQWLPQCAAYPAADIFIVWVIRLFQNRHGILKSAGTAAVLHRRISHSSDTVRVWNIAIFDKAIEFDRMSPTISKVIFIIEFGVYGKNILDRNLCAVQTDNPIRIPFIRNGWCCNF